MAKRRNRLQKQSETCPSVVEEFITTLDKISKHACNESDRKRHVADEWEYIQERAEQLASDIQGVEDE